MDRQGAGAQRVEQFIVIPFFASLRPGVFASLRGLPLGDSPRGGCVARERAFFRQTPEACVDERVMVERLGGPPIGECTPRCSEDGGILGEVAQTLLGVSG